MSNDTKTTMIQFQGNRRCFNPDYVFAMDYIVNERNPMVRLFLDVRTANGVFYVNVPVPRHLTETEAIEWICGQTGISITTIPRRGRRTE